MRKSAEAIIQCPFFKKELRNLLCCEGFVEGTCMTTAFSDRKAALDYISDNCTRMDGGSCPMAKNLFAKYEKIRAEEEKARMRSKGAVRGSFKKEVAMKRAFP